MNRHPHRFVSRGRRELNKAFAARDLEAVKKHTKRELQLLTQLHRATPAREGAHR